MKKNTLKNAITKATIRVTRSIRFFLANEASSASFDGLYLIARF